MPEKFDLTYINEENEKVRPVIIHRAVFGSIDKTITAVMVEAFKKGNFKTVKDVSSGERNDLQRV